MDGAVIMFELLLDCMKIFATACGLYFQFLCLYLALKHPYTLNLVPKSYKLTVVVVIVLVMSVSFAVSLAQLLGVL